MITAATGLCVGVLVWGSLQVPALPGAQPPAAEVQVKQVVEGYFRALAARDLDGCLALWLPSSPGYAARKEALETLFSMARRIEVEKLEILQVETGKDSARVVVAVRLQGADRKTGAPLPALGEMRRIFYLVRRDGAWKVRAYVAPEQELMEDLRRAATSAERRQLLQRHRDLVGVPLLQLLLDQSRRLHAQGSLAEALRVADAALEAAEQLTSAAFLSLSHLQRARVLRDQPAHAAALESCRAALRIVMEARDLPGQVWAHGEMGLTYQAQGMAERALEEYRASLEIARRIEDRAGEAITLRNMGDSLTYLGRYVEAREHYEASLKVEWEQRGPAEEARILNDLGIVHYYLGEYPQALARLEAGLKIRRELKDAAGEADTLNNLGLVRQAQGSLKEGLAHHQASLAIYRRMKHRAGEARALINIANVHRSEGRYPRALAYYHDVLALGRELGDQTLEALALNNIALVYIELGRLHEAIDRLQACLKLKQQLRDRGRLRDRGTEADTLGNLGTACRVLGRYEEALAWHRAALKLSEELEDPVGVAHALHNIGSVYFAQGQYAQALEQLQASLKISRRLGRRADVAATLTSIGGVYQALGQTPDALEQYRLGMESIEGMKKPRQVADILAHTASAYQELGRDAGALDLWQACLGLRRQLGDRPGEMEVLNNIGNIHLDHGRHEEAVACLEASLRLSREVGSQGGEAAALGSLGNINLARGRYEDAVRDLGAGLALAERLGETQTSLLCWSGLGNVYRKQGQWQKAAAHYREAIARIEWVRAEARVPQLQMGFLGQHAGSYRRLADVLRQLDRPAEAFAVSEQAKARALVELMQRDRVSLRKAMSAAERQAEAGLRERLTALDLRLGKMAELSEMDPGERDRLLRERDRVRGELATFRHLVFLAHPQLQTQRGAFDAASLEELNRQLLARHPEMAILSYLFSEDRLLVFVLTAGKDPRGPAELSCHVQMLDPARARAEVDDFRRYCGNPQDRLGFDTSQLQRWLIAPAEARLRGKEHLLIVPDVLLHPLPFQALRDEEGRYLLERFSISYAPSVTALVGMCELGRRRQAEGRGDRGLDLLAIGRPSFAPGLRDLPGTESCVQGIARVFGRSTRVLLRQDATEKAVKELLPQARYIHLATHGLLNDRAPMDSAIALSAAEGPEDGRLLARELVDMELRPRLVVLSACQTALGQQLSGEGMVGLTWSLFVAGTPSTVVSQWSVDDRSTGELMQTFYRHLLAGAQMTGAEALRRAQLEILGDRGRRHPYYWAPFILVGDWMEQPPVGTPGAARAPLPGPRRPAP